MTRDEYLRDYYSSRGQVYPKQLVDRPGTLAEKLSILEEKARERGEDFNWEKEWNIRQGVEPRTPYPSWNGAFTRNTEEEAHEFNQILGQQWSDFLEGESSYNPFPITTAGLKEPSTFDKDDWLARREKDNSITFEKAWAEAKQEIAAGAQAILDKEADARTEAARAYYEGLGLWGKVKLLFKRRY